jgi:hypothetical protein
MPGFDDWKLRALQVGTRGAGKLASGQLQSDYTREEKAKFDEQQVKNKSLKSSLTKGGWIGGLLGLAALAVFAPAGLLAMPALAWGAAAGVGAGIGAGVSAWTGESAEGLTPGMFEQHDYRVANEEYFDRLRSGVVETGLTGALIGYGAGNLAPKAVELAFGQGSMELGRAGAGAGLSTAPPAIPTVPDVGTGLNKFVSSGVSNKMADYSSLPSSLISSIIRNKSMTPLELLILKNQMKQKNLSPGSNLGYQRSSV